MIMTHIRFILSTLLAISIMASISGQKVETTDSVTTIPFRLTDHNNIVLTAILNESDTVDLMFHTAASAMTLIREAAEQTPSVEWTEEQSVNTWGGDADARFSPSNVLRMADLRWDSIAIWENERSGPETVGKVGMDLFGGRVVEIDFSRGLMIIQQQLPPKVANYVKTPLILDNGFMFLEGVSTIGGQAYKNRFLVHSGYGGTILYDDQFVAESEIGAQIEITDQKELKDSYGNVLTTNKGKLPLFSIGSLDFENIPVGFFEGAIARQRMSVMGGDLLKRFNLIIDAERGYVYLQANELRYMAYNDR